MTMIAFGYTKLLTDEEYRRAQYVSRLLGSIHMRLFLDATDEEILDEVENRYSPIPWWWGRPGGPLEDPLTNTGRDRIGLEPEVAEELHHQYMPEMSKVRSLLLEMPPLLPS